MRRPSPRGQLSRGSQAPTWCFDDVRLASSNFRIRRTDHRCRPSHTTRAISGVKRGVLASTHPQTRQDVPRSEWCPSRHSSRENLVFAGEPFAPQNMNPAKPLAPARSCVPALTPCQAGKLALDGSDNQHTPIASTRKLHNCSLSSGSDISALRSGRRPRCHPRTPPAMLDLILDFAAIPACSLLTGVEIVSSIYSTVTIDRVRLP
ncbi:hypothetical protein BD309DRAFT_271329 [Dichomitus squalens]|nr:hypothetical protein BD309DRAFT_271329 [Dichomitus squalens]